MPSKKDLSELLDRDVAKPVLRQGRGMRLSTETAVADSDLHVQRRSRRATPLPDRSQYKGSLPLTDMLHNRRWMVRSRPFPHIVAENVFKEHIYQALEESFRDFLAPDGNRFARNMPGYDAFGMEFTPHLTGPFSVFVSRAWHDMIAHLMGVHATNDVVGSLHHHEIGSANGQIHNDLNPGWFVDNARDDGINICDPAKCSYQTGEIFGARMKPRETIRAVAILFYVNNPPWSPGDGGETGLYRSSMDPIDSPVSVVPPINNSLLIFESTPYSYHSFLSNRGQPRDSVTMWLHRSKDEVVARWGEEKIVYW